ncbi:hypothetical protein BH24ACT23_BH24ACT23_12030 [soil metagenome]
MEPKTLAEQLDQPAHYPPGIESPALVIRSGTPADAYALERLAQLDSAPVPTGRVLLAERGDVAVAAIAIDSGSVVADPFRPTAGIAAMLAMQRRELIGTPAARRPWHLGIGRGHGEAKTGFASVGA